MIQLQFLNKLLDTGDASLITANNITDEFFPDYRSEFNYIKAHLQKYNNIPDKATFLTSFPDFDIVDVKEGNNYLLDALYEERNRSALTKTFNKMREALNAGKTDEALNIFQNSTEILTKARHIESVDIYQDISRYDEYIDKVANIGKYYVTTGFPELDKVLGGWDRRNEYATIIARPGQSKTFNLLKMCVAAAQQGLNVGLYEGEMEVSKVGYRIDTLISHISNRSLTKGVDDVAVSYKKFLEMESERLRGSIKVLTPSMAGGSVGVSALKSFIEKDHLDMLCVDQHSLLEDDRGGKNSIERAANISKDLKQLQVMSGIPIITVSQQNRVATDDRGATTTNVAQSDRIGQDSTVVIALEKEGDALTMRLIKSRDGGDGAVIKYVMDLDHGIFQYIPNESDATPDHKDTCIGMKNEFEYTPEELEEYHQAKSLFTYNPEEEEAVG